MPVRRIYQRAVKRLLSLSGNDRINDSPLLPYVDRAALFSPKKLQCFGTPYGGWIIPVDFRLSAESTCYSAGAGEDISFDCALVQRFHCLMRLIDPTPRAIQHFNNLKDAVKLGKQFPINHSEEEFYRIGSEDLERILFLPVGLADQDTELKFYMPKNPTHVSCSIANLQKTENYFTAPCLRLANIMQQQGDVSIDLLKIDIEGAEYGVIQDLIASNLLPRLLLVEFDEAHTPLDSDAGIRIKRHIDDLVRVGMTCIAVEGSNATFLKQACVSADRRLEE